MPGYFTSRPTSKGWIRSSTAFLQAVRQLEVLTPRHASRGGPGAPPGASSPLVGTGSDALEEAIALLQHHDAITGTEKQHVTNDYHRRLQAGRGVPVTHEVALSPSVSASLEELMQLSVAQTAAGTRRVDQRRHTCKLPASL